MLNIGDAAPDFPLPSKEGGPRTLRACLAEGPVLLYFYPADFTRVCTAQACMLRDVQPTLTATSVRIIGVSPQGDESHGAFIARYGLPFTLVADTDREVARLYGVSALFGLLTRRATFLIDKDGTVVDRAVADLSLGSHQDLVRRAISRFTGERTSST
ncbi:MAG: peroxiredoxin [Phycisphaerales bacterium]|jgi:peroxiredoxin Q/BCP|nr:peroxiredoxin [Phycisphaerales bacterium]